ncbi:MAG: ribosome-associated translation inhibitor RaiA [Candidatus Moranbacteria bacterium]|nr:ribosome-associated translation inhibitor RaiA [Candidatus Moranbacteria bacterium]
MHIKYLFENVDVSARTRAYIEKRFSGIEKLLEEKEVDATFMEVEIDKDKRGMYRVEVTVKSPKNRYRSEEISETIEASVDVVNDELKRQIREEKEKFTTLHKRGARSIKKKMVIDENARF